MVTLITREDLNSLKTEEVGKFLQKGVDDFKLEIKEITTVDALKDREASLMADMQEYDTYLNSVTYKLPDGVDFNGMYLSKSDIFKKIVELLNKMEVTWQFVPGLFQMSNLWRNFNMTTIDYHKYDSTLSCLGQLKYKGYKEWGMIYAINTYMGHMHDTYTKDTSYMIYLSQLHNSILDQMQTLNGVDPVTGEASSNDNMIFEKEDTSINTEDNEEKKTSRKRK